MAAYANFGTQVTILEGADDILSVGFEKQMTHLLRKTSRKKVQKFIRKQWLKVLKKQKMAL